MSCNGMHWLVARLNKEICKKDSVYHILLEWQEQYLTMEGTLDMLFKEEG